MSIQLMTVVWSMDLPASDKMVLLALADAANDDGVTWIALRSKRGDKADLLRKCSLSERAIQGAIKRLCEAGYLRRLERPGRGVIYTVTPAGDAPPQEMRPAGDAPAPAGDAGKPSLNPQSEAKASCERVISAWKEMAKAHGFPVPRIVDASLRQKIRIRTKEHGEALLLEAIAAVPRSPWLRGEGRDSKWRPNLDWVMTPANLRKVLEGTYETDEPISGKWTPERQAEYAARLRNSALADDQARWKGVGAVAAKILGEARPQ